MHETVRKNEAFDSIYCDNDRLLFKNTPLPTIDFVVRKQKELLEGLNYKYTDSEINLMVKEKQRFKRNPTNFAFQKSELLKQKVV
jgi:RNA polymerase-associated protein RTF1